MAALTIGRLSKRTGAKAGTIRFYERQGLLPAPERTHGNYRQYGEADVGRISFIRRARNLGFSLNTVRQLIALMESPEQARSKVLDLVSRQLSFVDEQIRELQTLRVELVLLTAGCDEQHSCCRALDAMCRHDP